jgi:hypothetical protein
MFMAVTSVLLFLDVTQRLRRATALIRRYGSRKRSWRASTENQVTLNVAS